MHRPECDDGCIALEQLRGEMNTRLASLQIELATATKGVNNFRAFQLDVTRKVGFIHGAAWFWSGLLAIILAICAYLFSQAIPIGKALLEDYYTRHPNAKAVPKMRSDHHGDLYTAHISKPEVARW